MLATEQSEEMEEKTEVGVARAVGMRLWSPRARLITTADCVGDGRNTLAAHQGGVTECPQRQSGSQMLLSLSISLSPSLFVISLSSRPATAALTLDVPRA